MSPPAPQERYLACAESACAHLDAVHEYALPNGEAPGLLVLHGLALYARDTTRSALTLLRDAQTLGAAALTRVVLEHAVLAQWLNVDPDTHGDLFLQQSQIEQYRWFEVVEAAQFQLSDPVHAALKGGKKPKNVAQEFATLRNLFGDTDMGKQMYLTYRNLSRFVHPASTTFSRYTEPLPLGLLLSTRQRVEQDPEAIAFYLASATVMCTLPYLDVLGQGEAASLLAVARAAGVATTIADA